jgi:hypothetical protein
MPVRLPRLGLNVGEKLWNSPAGLYYYFVVVSPVRPEWYHAKIARIENAKFAKQNCEFEFSCCALFD